MLVGIHRIATPNRFILVWCQVNPELAGFPPPTSSVWRDSNWHRDRIAEDPKRVAYVEAFKQQHTAYQEMLRQGFQHALIGVAAGGG
jgi:hypothetical protein